jgi:hypothetical protein
MPVEIARLRATVEHLASFDRPSASEGERQAAEWIRGELQALGVPARVEEERAVGSMAIPLGLLSAAGVLATLGGRRTAALGLLTAAAIVDDVSGGPHVFRRLLPHRPTWNVTGEAGDPDAEETLVFVAHHDAANGGLIFRPELTRLVADAFPRWYARQRTSPQMMRLVAGGPALAALGALAGLRPLRRAGLTLAAGSALAFFDIGTRTVVPGANDNLTAVAVLLELARLLREQPVRGVRVLLVSTGSEESFMEGMRGFMRRHGPSLPPRDTFVLAVDTVGSPHLTAIRGEGMLRMNEYPRAALDLVDSVAEELGVWLFPNLRLRNATDGLIALKAGYPCACLGSVTDYKAPANYHWRTDTPENVDYGTMADGVRLCEAVVRRLDERWLDSGDI